MRISGVSIPKQKRVQIALTYVFGIGNTRSEKILNLAQIDPNKRVKDLSQDEQTKIREIIERQYTTEGDLRRQVGADVKRLRDIKSYRGSRHSKRLPVRGQRTKTNSRTRRGNVRNMAVSGKKKAAAKT